MAEMYIFGSGDENKLGLKDDDVVSVEKQSIVKLGLLTQSVYNWAMNIGGKWPNPSGEWFLEKGISCEILRTKGGGWQKGRLRFKLEFIPDEPKAFIDETDFANPSPLDDLRSDLKI
ncbi:hypothetical protein H6G54_12110 [Anabaena cylindrica FACHB-243]|nr:MULTISPECIES: KGK domain-containing protein [Anabaena]MBD2418427.1 hypothetical protein [Anabaena cylindrica FACHB-243]MBY5284892.1 hypothetical protein [Anabaena sp. CCAP 1446/1C]MBY5307650.1 hypothetical protein [Anabaena sp. CCAP 1446/1C]MCM2409389.1 hypothetical protein [Anabaena sp. CCAP 1446/1C]